MLQAQTDLNEACVAAVLSSLRHLAGGPAAADGGGGGEGGEAARAGAQQHAGRLLGVDWKVGVRVAAREGEEEKGPEPFVTLAFRVADGVGSVRVFPAEMSLKEFRACSTSFQDMARAMERL